MNAALGFRAHSGWAAMVAVTGSPRKPLVLDRRRIVTADPGIPGSRQPFHTAGSLDLQQAETLIISCRKKSTLLATDAVTAITAQLAQKGHRVTATAILFAAGRPLPGLAAILKSHALIHTAEGEFFREVLVRASEQCSLPIIRLKEREAWEQSAALFHISPEALRTRIDQLGRTLGPPWTQDEKLASLAAWIAMAEPATRESTQQAQMTQK